MNRRVFGAILVGAGLIAAAFVLSDFGRTTSNPATTEATGPVVVGNAPVRQYIPTEDSNQDGVPDWQEQLLSPDETISLEETTTYREPETLTEQFAVRFFEDMVRNKQYGDFGENPEEFIMEASNELTEQAYDTLYTAADISVSTNASPEAVRAYANAVANSSLEHSLPAGTQNEATILEQALAQDNPELLRELEPIIAAYRNLVKDMKALPVPRPLAKQHLDLLNAYYAIERDVTFMRQSFNDPLAALLRLQRYQDDATGLYYAYTNLFAVAAEAGAQFQPGDATLEVVEFD